MEIHCIARSIPLRTKIPIFVLPEFFWKYDIFNFIYIFFINSWANVNSGIQVQNIWEFFNVIKSMPETSNQDYPKKNGSHLRTLHLEKNTLFMKNKLTISTHLFPILMVPSVQTLSTAEGSAVITVAKAANTTDNKRIYNSMFTFSELPLEWTCMVIKTLYKWQLHIYARRCDEDDIHKFFV